MAPKSVSMIKRNIRWIFRKINKLINEHDAAEEENESVLARVAQCPRGVNTEQMEYYLQEIREIIVLSTPWSDQIFEDGRQYFNEVIDNYNAKKAILVRMSQRHESSTRKLNVKLHEAAKEDFLVAVSHFVNWSATIAAILRDANNITLEMGDVTDAEIIINVHKLFPLTRTINLRTISDRLSREIKKLLEGADIPFKEII